MDFFTLWENDQFTISTPKNPHTPYREGLHVIVSPKQKVANAWQDADLSGATFQLAATACKIMENLGLAPWFNIQANGNWGLLPGAEPSFHIHIHGRNKTETWGKPLILPEAPGTYQNDPMPEADRDRLIDAFKTSLEL
jgi:diadenosine tetraphosphate (Ap4A) HIT family hydrolase